MQGDVAAAQELSWFDGNGPKIEAWQAIDVLSAAAEEGLDAGHYGAEPLRRAFDAAKNDPALPANLTPGTKAAGGTNWSTVAGKPNATALEVLADIQAMFWNLQVRLNGNVDTDSKMTLISSPSAAVAKNFVNEYGLNVEGFLKQAYPNLTWKTVPEYKTGSGEQIQLVVDEIEGQRTGDCCFTEKMRAHPVVVEMSAFKQKKSQGTWGTVLYRPAAVQGMLGI